MDASPRVDLLDGLEGADREERLELLEWLRAEHDVGEAELARATADGTLVLLAAGRTVGSTGRHTARDIARESGLELELWRALGRASALPQPLDPDLVHYGDLDLASARTAKRFLDAGLAAEQLLATVRVLGRGLAQTAELMRQAVIELALAPGVTEKELAARSAEVAQTMVPMVGPLVEQMLLLHLNHAVREEVVTAAERRAGALPGAREITVAFADLVGFTRLGEELAPDALEQVAEHLAQLTFDAVDPPVRFVKSVGDAVLLVSPDPRTLLEAAHALMAAAEAEGEEFPQLRIGVASGAAVSRAGDWFGRPVNLASRITTVARAGSVVTDKATRDALDDAGDLTWSSVGERRLKGVPSAVRLYRSRPRPDDRG